MIRVIASRVVGRTTTFEPLYGAPIVAVDAFTCVCVYRDGKAYLDRPDAEVVLRRGPTHPWEQQAPRGEK